MKTRTMMIAAAVVLLGGWVSAASAAGCTTTVAAGKSDSCTTATLDLPGGSYAVVAASSYFGLKPTPATVRLYVAGSTKIVATFNGGYDGNWLNTSGTTKKMYVTISTDNRNGSTPRTLGASLNSVTVLSPL